MVSGDGPMSRDAAALVDGSRVGVVMGGEDIQRRQHLVTETEKFPEYGRPAAVPASRVEADGRLGIEGHLRRRDRFRAAYLLRARPGDGCGFVAADLPVPCAGYFIPGVARNLRRAVPAHVLGEVTARGVRARLARGDGRMRARGHVDVAERAEIRPQPAHKRQGCGLDLFDAAHAFLGVLPDGPRFRAEFVRGRLGPDHALPAGVLDLRLRRPRPVAASVRPLVDGGRALPELFTLRHLRKRHAEGIGLPDDRMIRPSVGEPDHDLRARFREAEKAFLLPRPGRHGKGDRRIGREGRIGLPVRREDLDVHGIARAEAFRGRPLDVICKYCVKLICVVVCDN